MMSRNKILHYGRIFNINTGMNKCDICNAEFNDKRGLANHMRHHNGHSDKFKEANRIKGKLGGLALKNKIHNEYILNPKICEQCGCCILYEFYRKSAKRFCSLSCSTTHANINSSRKYGPKKGDKKTITINGVKMPYLSKSTSTRAKNVCGPFSKIYLCNCKICERKCYYRTMKQYCDTCKIKRDNLSNIYKFTFKMWNYPDLFDLEYVKNVGSYHPINNKNGWTRDHKVSVFESIKHNYDEYYIKHPLNCELLDYYDNITKNTKSSISYEDLITLVDEYDYKNGVPGKN